MPLRKTCYSIYRYYLSMILIYEAYFVSLKYFPQEKLNRGEYFFIVSLYIIFQFILINYISPLLNKNYFAIYWISDVGYVISVIIYVICCLLFTCSLVILQFYFLKFWCFRLNDICLNKFICIIPLVLFLIVLINNFFIFNPWVKYFYYLSIFLSCILPSRIMKSE